MSIFKLECCFSIFITVFKTLFCNVISTCFTLSSGYSLLLATSSSSRQPTQVRMTSLTRVMFNPDVRTNSDTFRCLLHTQHSGHRPRDTSQRHVVDHSKRLRHLQSAGVRSTLVLIASPVFLYKLTSFLVSGVEGCTGGVVVGTVDERVVHVRG